MASPARTFDAWLKGDWKSPAKELRTSVVVIGKDEDSDTIQQLKESKEWKRHLNCEKHYVSYSSFVSSEDDSKLVMDMDDLSTVSLKVCVMIEPSDNEEEMEKAYRQAKKQGMPVLIAWKTADQKYSFISFVDLSMETKMPDSGLFDNNDDNSDEQQSAPLLARQMVGNRIDPRYKRQEINHGIITTISMIGAMLSNEEARKLAVKSDIFNCKGWMQIHDRSSLKPLFCYYRHLIDLGFYDTHNLQVLSSSDLKGVLFVTSKDSRHPLCSITGSLYLDLNEDSIELVKKLTAEAETVPLRYRTQKGFEFTLEFNKHTRQMLHNMPVSFDELWTVICRCAEDSDLSAEMVHDLTEQYTRSIQGSHRKVLLSISDRKFQSVPKVPLLDVLIRLLPDLKRLVSFRNTDLLGEVLEKFGHRVNPDDLDYHWTELLSKWNFNNPKQRLQAFKKGLFTIGLAPTKKGWTAFNYAMDKGDSELIRAAKAFEKSQKSSSTIEEEMAEDHKRWASQSDYFVKKYILKGNGSKGEECVKILMNGLMRLIQDRGDFTDIDLMGIVWHSSDYNRDVLLKKLMMAMETTLDYDTVHSDKVGWQWARDVVMKHPVWLSADPNQSGAKKDESVIMDDLLMDEEKTEDDDGITDGIDEESSKGGEIKEQRVLFQRLCEHSLNQMDVKSGGEINDALKAMIREDKNSWRSLCAYQAKNVSGVLRQDEIDEQLKSDLSEKELDRINLMTNSLDFNVRKTYDSKAILTKILIQAHLVNPNFMKLMNEVLCQFGEVQFGPVKLASRVEPKSEEYANEGREWPHTACVIDLVRCSVTVNTLSEMVAACIGFEDYISAHSDVLSICRFKNGFGKHDPNKRDDVPASYTDIKFNVACKSEDLTRSIIGEVQILLRCVLDAKLKAHELYEVSRSLPLYMGAARRFQTEHSFNQQLLLTGGSERLLVSLLTLTPFLFTVENTDFSLLLKSDLKSEFVIKDMANAIVVKSNTMYESDSILDAIIKCFESFKTGQSCFGLGSGKLICEIIDCIAKSKGIRVVNQVKFDFYQRMVEAMNEHELDMGLCFNLFMDLDRSIKKKLDWQASFVVKKFKYLQSLETLIPIYDGFAWIDHFESFMNKTRPEYWSEYDKNDISVLVRSVQKVLDTSWTPDYRFHRIRHVWLPIVIRLRGQMAAQILMDNIETLLTNYKYLSTFVDQLDSVSTRLRNSVFVTRNVFGHLSEWVDKNFLKEAVRRFQRYYPTIDMMDLWCGEFMKYNWAQHQKFFPEVYVLSERKRQQVCQKLIRLKRGGLNSYQRFTSFFGSDRSEQARLVIWEWSVTELCGLISDFNAEVDEDAVVTPDQAIQMILELLPNKKWPYLRAWMNDQGTKHPCLTLFGGELLKVMPDQNRSKSGREYLKWQKSGSPSLILDGWPLHSYLGIIGDNVNITRAVIDGFESQLGREQMELPMILRADWHSEEAAKEMAGHIFYECRFSSTKELMRYLIQQLDQWLVSIRFGINTGKLIYHLFRMVQNKGSSARKRIADDSKSGDEDLSEDCASFVSVLLKKGKKGQTQVSMVVELLISLPRHVIAQLPDSTLSALIAVNATSDWERPMILPKLVAVLKLLRENRKSVVAATISAVIDSDEYYVRRPDNAEEALFLPLQDMFELIDEEDYSLIEVKFTESRVKSNMEEWSKVADTNRELKGLQTALTKLTALQMKDD